MLKLRNTPRLAWHDILMARPDQQQIRHHRNASGASPSRLFEIARGKYAPKSRSPDAPPVIMMLTQEFNVVHVVHSGCCGIDGHAAQLTACLRRVGDDGTIHTE